MRSVTLGDEMAEHYSERYRQQAPMHVYPVEFVVRSFLGTYPGLSMDRKAYAGSRILDLGYGDGRNMPLLKNLGFSIFGVEIHAGIERSAQERLRALGIEATLSVGWNAAIPFPDSFFQFALACHSFYYVQEGKTFADNLRELHRVMSPSGTFVLSLPMADGYILKDAEPLGDGHVRIAHDPYGLRVGSIFRVFSDRDEIERAFTPWFRDFRVGFTDDDFWGLRQRMWIVVCTRH